MTSCPSCGNEIDGDYCSSCEHQINSNIITNPVIKKKSKFWYLLPVFLGIIGGVIAYLVLRKSDSRKARNCLLIGIVFMIIGIGINVAIESTLTDEQREGRRIINEQKAEETKLEREEEELQKEIKRLEERDAKRMTELIKQTEIDAQEAILDTEEEVLEFVQNYKGIDNSGLTLDQTLGTLLNAAYPGEDIISSPSTTGGYIASRDYDKEISDRYWKVEFMIKTYREAVSYEWVVDTETNLIYPKDIGSKSVLDILDGFN